MAWFIAGVFAVILVFGYFGVPILWWTIAAALLTWYLGAIAGAYIWPISARTVFAGSV